MACILVIDDSRDMLSLLETMLKRQTNHDVIVSLDGYEGLEKAFTELPDVAIVDVMMPGMSGYDVIRKLRADPRTKNIGIITLTARGQSVDRTAALEAGANAFLTKPVQVEDLIQEIKALLKQPTSSSSSKAWLLPVFSLKGGVGVTTVAVNIATLLQQAGGGLLLDLSPNSGHCAVALGIRPTRHWGQLLENPQTPVTRVLLQHTQGLQLLAAPPLPAQRWFTPEQFNHLLSELMSSARFIVVDMPPRLDDITRHVIKIAARTLIITGDDSMCLQSTHATLQVLQEYHERLRIVHNALTPGTHPSVEVLQKALKLNLVASIPYAPEQRKTLRQGVPLALSAPQSPFTTSIKRTIQKMLSH